MIGPRPRPRLQLIAGKRISPPRETLPAYRPYTRAILRRYFRVAIDIGRLPSILGGLSFRARVSSYRLRTFEDAVIFVHDMERVFDRIERPSMEIIAGAVLLEYSLPEVALRLGISVRGAERRYAAAMDALSSALLEVGLLCPVFAADGDPTSASRIHAAAHRSSKTSSPLIEPFDPAPSFGRSLPIKASSHEKGASRSGGIPARCTISPSI